MEKNHTVKKMCELFIQKNHSLFGVLDKKINYDDRWNIIDKIEINNLKRFIAGLSLLVYLEVDKTESLEYSSLDYKNTNNLT